MSMIKVEFDTLKKEVYAEVDGKPVQNINQLYCGVADIDEDGKPQFYFEISSMEYDKENKMAKTGRIVATLRQPESKDALYSSIANIVFPSA